MDWTKALSAPDRRYYRSLLRRLLIYSCVRMRRYPVDVLGLVLEKQHCHDGRIRDLLFLLNGQQLVDCCVGIVEFMQSERLPKHVEWVLRSLVLLLAEGT